jgi:2-haloacid dehalogenase
MNYNRRDFLKAGTIAAVSGIAMPSLMVNKSEENTKNKNIMKRPKVLFFDVNETLLDLTSMKTSVGNVLNGKEELLPLWFTTMLQYSLVTTVTNQYQDFGKIGVAALLMVAKNNSISLTEAQAKEAIISSLLSLPPHPEVVASLSDLKEAGFKIVSLTNSSNFGVNKQFENAKLDTFFDYRLSVEDIGKYKPHLDTYAWAARKMNITPSESMLIAAHGWDIAGALAAGWRAAFVDRPGQALFPLVEKPEIVEPNLSKITKKLIGMQ